MAKLDWLLAYPKPTDDSPNGNLTPLSIMQPGVMFEQRGETVAYYDQRWDPPEMFDDLAKEAKNIGVSAFTGKQCARAAELLERAREVNPRITTHVGGHHARLCADDLKNEPIVDQVWPDRWYGEDLFPWSQEAQRLWNRGVVQFQTSRGCPYACSFCALRSPWFAKQVDQLKRELALIGNLRGGIEYLSITDPNIGFEREKVDGQWNVHNRIERMEAMGEAFRSFGLTWFGNVRSNYITPEYVDSLVRAGCKGLEFGCESGNEEFLRKVIQKGHGVESIKNAARLMRGSGISVMYSFIRGMPRESEQAKRDTLDLIDWIVDTDPLARVSIYNYAPYPGGPAYEDAVNGTDPAYGRFDPPKTMKGWGSMPLMESPAYWVTGLNFRMDNTRKNFPGEDWELIRPYVELARKKWRERDIDDFPAAEVASLVANQVAKNNRKEAA